MSTAQNTKSTAEAIAFTSEAFWTVRPATAAGTADLSAQRPFITSAYFCPAEFALAASSVTSYQGWFSSNARKRWPTMPVAPRTPTFSFFWDICSSREGRREKGWEDSTGSARRRSGPAAGAPARRPLPRSVEDLFQEQPVRRRRAARPRPVAGGEERRDGARVPLPLTHLDE